MFVVRKTVFVGQLFSFLLASTNFYGPQIRKSNIGHNTTSAAEDYEQDTKKGTNDGGSRRKIPRHYRVCILSWAARYGAYIYNRCVRVKR